MWLVRYFLRHPVYIITVGLYEPFIIPGLLCVAHSLICHRCFHSIDLQTSDYSKDIPYHFMTIISKISFTWAMHRIEHVRQNALDVSLLPQSYQYATTSIRSHLAVIPHFKCTFIHMYTYTEDVDKENAIGRLNSFPYSIGRNDQ